MYTNQEIMQHLSFNGATPGNEHDKAWHTRNILLAYWCNEQGIHVRGSIDVAGYSALIYLGEKYGKSKSGKESFVIPVLECPAEVKRDRFFEVAAQYDHSIAAWDIFGKDIEKLIDSLYRKRTDRNIVFALVEVAYVQDIIDIYWNNRFKAEIEKYDEQK